MYMPDSFAARYGAYLHCVEVLYMVLVLVWMLVLMVLIHVLIHCGPLVSASI